jgi:uncharacterized membrane protein
VLAGLVVAWILVFAHLVRLRQDRFGSFDFDMGIHDQSVWLLAHFRGFSTVRGLQVFGHHATIGYLFFVPAYWLGAGPDFLNVTQVVVAALGAVPVFLLARHRSGSGWLGVAFGAAFLLHPALQLFMQELFHPEVLAITPLLCAYYCSVRRRWGWFALWCAVAVCWKEDIALAVMLLGILVALRGDRRVGLVTAAAAAAWFAAWTLVLFPVLDHGAIQSVELYRDVGGSPGGMVRTMFTHPSRLTSRLVSDDSGDYLFRLASPFGLLAVLAPVVALIGAPQTFLNLVTNVPWTKTIDFHYAAMPLAAITIASVEGGCWLVRMLGSRASGPSNPTGRRITRRQLVLTAVGLVVLACAFSSTVSSGASPLADDYRMGMWPLEASPRTAAQQAAVDRIPAGAAVSASYNLVPHLTHRPEIYTFPNPWESRNFGIGGSPRRSGARVDWIVVDRSLTSAEDATLLTRLLRHQFAVVFERDDIVVAKRIHAPPR